MHDAIPVGAKDDPGLAGSETFGMKVCGLAGLSAKWTPAYFAIGRFPSGEITDTERLQAAVASLLPTLGSCQDGLIVRSSAIGETLNDRGSYDSLRCGASCHDVTDAIAKLLERTTADLRGQMAFLIQEWRDGVAVGHLSNERRASPDRRGWLCEAELPIEGEDKRFRFRVDKGPPDPADLACADWEALAAALRSVARAMHQTGKRFHLEWVWDGVRVWVVQCDEEIVERGEPPGSAWNRPIDQEPLTDLRRFRRINTADTGFPKVAHVALFEECGFPRGDIRVLSGGSTIREIATGLIPGDVEEDLRSLIQSPVVVRTDFRAQREHPVLMSKRTDTCTDLPTLRHFLISTARELIDAGGDPDDIAFLVHRFRLAKAGAFSFGRPESPTVRIDATWGLPDGLLFHPHDSYRVDLATKGVERYARCKTEYVDVTTDGSWRSRPAGSDWDWRPTLTDEQAALIAEMTAVLAQRLERDIGVMFFVGGDPDSWVLPWFYEASEAAAVTVQPARGFYVGERITVTKPDDLRSIEERLSAAGTEDRFAIRLKPTVDYLRDRGFMTDIATVAATHDLTVELEGSQLSHAYYLLQSAGIHVRSLNPWSRPERRRSFGKLVRDLIPVRIERHGELASTYSANRDELAELIRAKIVEEAMEFFWAEGRTESLDELADLVELIRAAGDVQGITFAEVISAADEKKKERGGFGGGVVLVETRDTDTSTIAETGTSVAVRDEQADRRRSARRVIRLPGNRFIIPTAPPTSWKRGVPRTVVLSQELEATVSYSTVGIQVQIRPRIAHQPEEQLALF